MIFYTFLFSYVLYFLFDLPRGENFFSSYSNKIDHVSNYQM